MKRPFHLIATALLAFACIAVAPAQAQGPRVLVSIAPLHALVSGLMNGVGIPDLIVRGDVSPMSYALRPTQVALFAEADLIVLAGSDIDAFMDEAIAEHAGDARIIRLSNLDLPVILPPRRGLLWGAREGVEVDPYLWLDTENVAQATRVIMQALVEVDRLHKIDYGRNAETVIARLGGLDRQLRRAFAQYRGRPFMVQWDAFQYLERRYGLEALGSALTAPGAEPTADHLALMRDEAAALGSACLFALPQLDDAGLGAFADGDAVRVTPLDPFDAPRERELNRYFEMMRELPKAFARCLR